MKFILDNPNDIIQGHLARGKFYEEDYLKLMKQHCPDNAVILDLGANVGNHAIYFDKFFNPKIIYVIEPIPRFYKMLLCNIALNYCHRVNVDFIGLALADRTCIGYPHTVYGEDNLGSTRLSPEPFSLECEENRKFLFDPVQVVKGDDIFKDIRIDFIKMDIESMEMVALAGLSETIAKYRPVIFIEIIEDNEEDFRKWLVENNYKIEWQGEIIKPQTNYLIKPE